MIRGATISPSYQEERKTGNGEKSISIFISALVMQIRLLLDTLTFGKLQTRYVLSLDRIRNTIVLGWGRGTVVADKGFQGKSHQTSFQR